MKALLSISLFVLLFSGKPAINYNLNTRIVLANQLGYNVSNVGKYNERLSAKQRILARDKKVKNLVLGSSRMLKFKSKKKPNKKTLNLGVSSAVFNDVIALYAIYEKFSKYTPKKVYIGIDPWFFINSSSDRRWRKTYKVYYDHLSQLLIKDSSLVKKFPNENDSIKVGGISEVYPMQDCLLGPKLKLDTKFNYKGLLVKLSLEPLINEEKISQLNEIITSCKFTQLMLADSNLVLNDVGENLKDEVLGYVQTPFNELKYFQQYNVAKLNRFILELSFSLNPLKGKSDFPTLKSNHNSLTRLSSGTIRYAHKFESRKDKVVDKIVVKKMRSPYFLKSNFKMKSANTKFFESFIEHIQNNGSEVVIVMLPYHPKLYESMKDEKSRFHFPVELEKYLNDYAKKEELSLRGSFNPSTCHLGKEDFYDEMHFKEHAWPYILKTK